MLVVGAKEAENQAVSYRDRLDGDQGAMPLDEALARLKAECEQPAEPPGRAAPGRSDGRGRRPKITRIESIGSTAPRSD